MYKTSAQRPLRRDVAFRFDHFRVNVRSRSNPNRGGFLHVLMKPPRREGFALQMRERRDGKNEFGGVALFVRKTDGREESKRHVRIAAVA